MKRVTLLMLAAFGLFLGSSLPAQPSAPVDLRGLYVLERPDIMSALQLSEYRFEFMFSNGAIDMHGGGTWTRDGEGTIILTSNAPYEAPQAELAGTSRDDQPGIQIRIDQEQGDAPPFLEALAQYDNGEREVGSVASGEYRFDPGRRIVSVRIGSAGFNFWAEPFPVPADANVLTFRFSPNDLGIAHFQGQRVAVEPTALTFTFMGAPLRYVRADPEPGEAEAIAALRPRIGGASGIVDVRIGESTADMLARSAFEFNADTPHAIMYGNASPVELRLHVGDRSFEAGRVGGLENSPLVVTTSTRRQVVDSLEFTFQDRELTLAEALDRARTLKSWLEQSGFVLQPVATSDYNGVATFQVINPGPSQDVRAEDWAAASALLARESAAVIIMHLYTLRSGGHYASASLENVRRIATYGAANPPPANPEGREWRLEVRITNDPAVMQEELMSSAE